jgi:Tfp pilus assembly protein PilV
MCAFTPTSRQLHAVFPRKSAGFALIVTIILVAFLVLVLLGLATFTRVETQVASNGQQLAQARQHALMALNVAVGELQKYAGPDQRTTARSDLDPALANVSTGNGRWTGVYGSRVSADYNDTPDVIVQKINAAYAEGDSLSTPDPLTRKGSQAILLNWLVSGNERTAFNPLIDVSPADGRVTRTSAPTIAHQPLAPVDLATTSPTPGLTDTHTLLVGAQSVSSTSDRVSAPLVPISVPESALPGYDATSTEVKTVGRFAWWVGDENTKARVNLPLDPATTPPAIAFATAQRAGIELIDGVNATGSVPSTSIDLAQLLGHNNAYDPSDIQSVRKLIHPSQLPMISAQSGPLDVARRNRFHDLSTSSLSLLTDTYAGGLKKDLSALLAIGANAPADNAFLFVPNDATPASTEPVPTWGHLRNFVQRTMEPDSSEPSGFRAIPPRRPIHGIHATADFPADVGMFPVITFCEIGFEYFTNSGFVRLAAIPRVVLWNPHRFPIRANPNAGQGDFEFGIRTNGGTHRLQGAIIEGSPAVVVSYNDNLFSGSMANGGVAGLGRAFYRFKIDLEGQDIPPGESWVFTLPPAETGRSYTFDSTSAYNSRRPDNVLTRGNNQGYVIMPEPNIEIQPNQRFRVGSRWDGGTATFTGPFRENVTAYIGEIVEQGPLEVGWNTNPANTSKRWYQRIPEIGVRSAPMHPFLQPSSRPTPDAIDNASAGWHDLSGPATVGDAMWGLQHRHGFGQLSRYIANTNPRSANVAARLRALIGAQAGDIRTFDLELSNQPNLQHRASAGTSLQVVGDNPVDSILFEYRPADQTLLSLGQLQHANLSVWFPFSTSYAVGNSALPFTMKNLDSEPSVNRQRIRRANDYDYSYLLNRTLWDRYFVSTVPHNGTAASGVSSIPSTLPNSRHVRPWQGQANEENDLLEADKAAARLLISGGFNVNSTSEQAWRAVLGSINRLAHAPDGTLDPALGAALPRFSRPSEAIARNGSDPHWAFRGYRRLTEEQIARLAANTVAEVRNRGPFVSLADFINRRLRDNPDSVSSTDNANEIFKGALQNAIDNTPASGTGSINNQANVAPFTSGYTENTGDDAGDKQALRGLEPPPRLPYSSRAAFAPQFLTSADVLSAIGAGLSARSDTFTIRTYGDVLNPATGEVMARAWCEAVAQRTVEPIRRRSNNPNSPDYNEPAIASSIEADFGRRFQIISFRWLTSSDI